ncbi:MAG: hypothetical protein WCG78_00100 [Candidatus Omnitrophota bacterium]
MEKNILSMAALVSAVVSLLTTVVLKIIGTMLEHRSKISYEVAKRKLDVYSALGARTYELRNKARDLLTETEPACHLNDLALFADMVERYGTGLFDIRICLESDHIFKEVHTYKGLAAWFLRSAQAFEKQKSIRNDEGAAYHKEVLLKLYQRIDAAYTLIVQRIVTIESSLKDLS